MKISNIKKIRIGRKNKKTMKVKVTNKKIMVNSWENDESFIKYKNEE